MKIEMNKEESFISGLIIGLIVILTASILFAYLMEKSKVEMGYLTFNSEIYKVELFDKLDKPKKEIE